MAKRQTGRLLAWVRDRAVKAIDDGADLELWQDGIEVRSVVLGETRQILLSERPRPARIRGEPRPESPFAEGDVLRYRRGTGREVALWAMRNETRSGLAGATVSTEFQPVGLGDLHLPPLDQLLASEPLVLTASNG